MLCSKPFAERRRRRGLSLLEVMVSQSIALIVITGMVSMVGFMVKKLNAETKVSDAQVRLRQVSHLLLRDSQGVGGDLASAGDVVLVTDGGVSAPDEYRLFKRDESVCGGGLSVSKTPGNVIKFGDVSGGCPIGLDFCLAKELEGRAALVIGKRSATMTGQSATGGGACKLNFPTGKQGDDFVEGFNQQYGASEGNVNGVLNAIDPTQVLFGSSFIYRLQGSTLQRSNDGGATFTNILDNVFDLQVQREFLLADGVTIHRTSKSSGDEDFATEGATFLGLRIGLITFATSADGLEVLPPQIFGNRNHSGAPGARRYRASFVFAAARNRI